MPVHDVRTELLRLLKKLGFDPDDIVDTTRFRDDLDVDSTELVEIAVAIERSLPVTLDGIALDGGMTFGEMVTVVESAPIR